MKFCLATATHNFKSVKIWDQASANIGVYAHISFPIMLKFEAVEYWV